MTVLLCNWVQHSRKVQGFDGESCMRAGTLSVLVTVASVLVSTAHGAQ